MAIVTVGKPHGSHGAVDNSRLAFCVRHESKSSQSLCMRMMARTSGHAQSVRNDGHGYWLHSRSWIVIGKCSACGRVYFCKAHAETSNSRQSGFPRISGQTHTAHARRTSIVRDESQTHLCAAPAVASIPARLDSIHRTCLNGTEHEARHRSDAVANRLTVDMRSCHAAVSFAVVRGARLVSAARGPSAVCLLPHVRDVNASCLIRGGLFGQCLRGAEHLVAMEGGQ